MISPPALRSTASRPCTAASASCSRARSSRVRQFVRERREIARLAPHLVRVLPFVIPTSRRHPRPLMRAFLAGYDLLARDRNEGVDPAQRLPASRVISRAECLDLNPLIDARGVTGGAVWHDYQLHSPERLAIALVESMVRREAAAINYTEILAVLRGGGAVSGVRVRDRLSGEVFDVRAPLVINAAGPWASEILRRSDASLPADRRPGWSLAMNLVVDLPPLSCAPWAVSRADGFSSWSHGGQARLRAPVTGRRRPRAGPRPSASASVEAFLAEVRSAFPHANLTRDEHPPGSPRAAAGARRQPRRFDPAQGQPRPRPRGRGLQGVADGRGRPLHDGRGHGQGGRRARRPRRRSGALADDRCRERLPAADMGDLESVRARPGVVEPAPTRRWCGA